MLKRRSAMLAIAALFSTQAVADSPSQKSTGCPDDADNTKENRIVAGDFYIKKLLLLMDTDKNGKVSKKEFMSFMEKEFERLDVNHDGELDLQELAKIQVRPYVGK